jgi:hypothetical protein
VTIDGVSNGEWIYCSLMHTQLVTTSNYSATANLHNSQITAVTTKHFQACCVLASRSLASASSSGNSSASRTQALSSQPSVENSLSTNFVPCLKHISTDHIENRALLLLRPTVALLRTSCLATGTCLASRCPETVVVYRVIA